MSDKRRRCEHCGAVLHKSDHGTSVHYGAMEVCLRIRQLLFALMSIDHPGARAAIQRWNADRSAEKERAS